MAPDTPSSSAPTAAALLDFEAAHQRHTGAKENAIIATFEISPPRYYILLARAAASHEGQAHDAVTAHRVLRRWKQFAA